MKNDIEALKEEIDVLRGTMQKIATERKFYFCDNDVVAASANLDEILNLYQKEVYRQGKQSRARVGTKRGRSLYP